MKNMARNDLNLLERAEHICCRRQARKSFTFLDKREATCKSDRCIEQFMANQLTVPSRRLQNARECAVCLTSNGHRGAKV